MRFGQTLDRGAVPEWRSQYLAYTEGKRLISRLLRNKKTFDVRSGIPRTPRPSHLESTTTAEMLSPFLDCGSIALPPPALSIVPGRAASKQSVPTDPITETSPLLATAESQTSTRDEPNTKYSHDDLETLEAREFTAWLIKELRRVDAFYSIHELDAIEKLKALNQQLIILRRHQKHFLAARKGNQATLAVSQSALRILGTLELPTLPKYLRREASSSQTATPNHFENPYVDCSSVAGPSSSSGSPDRTEVPLDHNNRASTMHSRHVHAKQAMRVAHTRDFDHNPYTYLQARQMLKTALRDYYHEIKELRAFQALNETAVRKIIKKFDKTFHTNISEPLLKVAACQKFSSSHVLDGLLKEVENLFAIYYRQGNHKNAVQTLQAADQELGFYPEVLLLGLLYGSGVPLFVKGVIDAVDLLSDLELKTETEYLLQIWAGFLFIIMILNLFVVNMLVWRRYRVNYPFIFQLARFHHLDFRQFALMPGLLWFFMCLFGWLTFADIGALPGRYYPAIFLGLSCVGLMLPVPVFWDARRWMLIALIRLLFSGLYSVEFRDFFLGDIFCSLSYTMSNLVFFFCLWTISSWWARLGKAAQCSSSHSSVFGFFQCLPGIWRFLQCIRRYGDTLDWFPHLLNALKYSITILSYMFLSLSRMNAPSKLYRTLYYVFAALNSVYSSWWDIFMDFSLGPNLRSVLVYPRWTYYLIMLVDPLLRFNWVLYIPYGDQIQQSQKISFIVAAIEVIRRFLWIFFRVENEHAANIVAFRSYKDLELPYNTGPVGVTGEIRWPSTDQMPGSAELTGLETPGTSRKASLFHLSEVLERAHVRDFMRRKAVDDEDIDDYDDMNMDEEEEEEEE